jgi:hypothetical protein
MSEEAELGAERADVTTPEGFVEAIREGDLVVAMRAGYHVFSEDGGLDMSVFHPDAEWHQRPQLPDARTHRGRAQITRMNDHRVEMEEVHVWSFDDGLISEVREYLTKAEALRALGRDG